MALKDKGGFRLDLDEKFKKVAVDKPVTPVVFDDEYTYTDTDTDARAEVIEEKKEVKPKTKVKKQPKKENKTKRMYLLVKPSSFDKLSKYAEDNGDSLNNLIQTLMDQFIEEKDL
jgi:predicted HicB family RNase H-like nuclease